MATDVRNLKLTRRQIEILQFIDGFIYDNGYPPTIREIAINLGIKSQNGVVIHLVPLARKGYIKRTRLSTITILKPVPRDTMTVEIRVTCSRCGVKLLDDRITYQVRVGHVRQPKPAVDFCASCHDAFQAWLARGGDVMRKPKPLPGQQDLFEEMVREDKEKF